jgi:hypothetical protein
LFPAAKMPAVALFARHRSQRLDQMTVVQVPWSQAGAKSHTFEIAPSDVISLSLADWERQPARLKTAAFGRRRDLRLLGEITETSLSLDERLAALGTKLRDGLSLGHPGKRSRDAAALEELEFLQTRDLKSFAVPDKLRVFGHRAAEWPRSREVYRAPLLIVKEFLTGGPRPLAAVADRDLVFSDAYFGAAIAAEHRSAAHMMVGILSSALASWFFIMTASEFGLWKQRLHRKDVALFPTPDLVAAVTSHAGRRVLELEHRFQQQAPQSDDWHDLDEAVFDLYHLDDDDRIVVRDGFVKASWEWQAGLLSSIQPATLYSDLVPYATTFTSVIDRWLSARNVQRMRAEVFDLPAQDALRVVRFILEDSPGPSVIDVVRPDEKLASVLASIGRRLNVRIARAVTGQRELRVHGPSEVVIIKPAARRHWMCGSALEDADAVVAESFAGAAA